jgi:hypothetical protein
VQNSSKIAIGKLEKRAEMALELNSRGIWNCESGLVKSPKGRLPMVLFLLCLLCRDDVNEKNRPMELPRIFELQPELWPELD